MNYVAALEPGQRVIRAEPDLHIWGP